MAKLAEHIMTANPACCPTDMMLNEVAQLMRFNNCGEIPVVDLRDRLAGVITDRDIVTRVVAEGLNPAAHTAAQYMSHPVITVRSDDPIDEVVNVMERHQIRRVPVVDRDGRCVGIIAQADIATSAEQDVVAELVRSVSRDEAETRTATREPGGSIVI